VVEGERDPSMIVPRGRWRTWDDWQNKKKLLAKEIELRYDDGVSRAGNALHGSYFDRDRG
jgi:hypothetical protein